MDYKKELIKVIKKINDRVLAERLYVFAKDLLKIGKGHDVWATKRRLSHF